MNNPNAPMHTLDVLRRAQRGANAFLRRLGTIIAVIPIALLALKLVGLVLDGETASLFVQRMARLPWSDVSNVCIAGSFLALIALHLSNRASAVLEHLRRNPQDPLVDVATRVEVRRGYRFLLLAFRTRAGLVLAETVPGKFEEETLAAIRQARLPVLAG